MVAMADMEGNETFDASVLGSAEEVCEERVADDKMIMIKGSKCGRATTLLLRGANDYMLDEMDRSIHDSLCVVKRVLESGKVVPGGGAVEAALSVFLENFATTLGSREQLAIGEFANAALVLPKTLAVNAAKDATELVAALRAFHYKAQTVADAKVMAQFGLDLVEGKVRNNVEAGVLEPAMSKVKMIQVCLGGWGQGCCGGMWQEAEKDRGQQVDCLAEKVAKATGLVAASRQPPCCIPGFLMPRGTALTNLRNRASFTLCAAVCDRGCNHDPAYRRPRAATAKRRGRRGMRLGFRPLGCREDCDMMRYREVLRVWNMFRSSGTSSGCLLNTVQLLSVSAKAMNSTLHRSVCGHGVRSGRFVCIETLLAGWLAVCA